MSWNKLAPIAKSTGRPMVSASIVVNKDGAAKVSLVLSASIHEEYGERTKVDVSAGEGEDEGALLIEFDPAGAFDIKAFGKGGGRIYVPCGAGVPTQPASNLPCTVGARTNDSLVIKLPCDEWAREIASRRPASAVASPAGQAPAPGGGKPPINGASLDMAEYLRTRGRKVDRLAAGRFQVDGEVLTAGQALKLVNEHRKTADLDPLPAHKAW